MEVQLSLGTLVLVRPGHESRPTAAHRAVLWTHDETFGDFEADNQDRDRDHGRAHRGERRQHHAVRRCGSHGRHRRHRAGDDQRMNFSGRAWSSEFWLIAIATYNASMTRANTIGAATNTH